MKKHVFLLIKRKKVIYVFIVVICTMVLGFIAFLSGGREAGKAQEGNQAAVKPAITGSKREPGHSIKNPGKASENMEKAYKPSTLKNNGALENKVRGSEEDFADRIMGSMSIEERVGQLFIIAFRQDIGGNPVTRVNDSITGIMNKYKPGGIILFNENIAGVDQTVRYIDDLQRISEIPLFIAVDEEGGRVSRITGENELNATKIPSMEKIGNTGDPELAYEVGKIIGRELYALGFNMNFAPVADIKTNPLNRVISDRAFGSDPKLVADMAVNLAEGLMEEGVFPVMKHFPGHGDTILDTHNGQVIVDHDMDRLMLVEFVPFISGIGNGIGGIMTAHIRMDKITQDSKPATLSRDVLTGILRDKLEFKGLIITDALEMGAISKYWSSEQASLLAINAGADILLMPLSFEEAYKGVIKAVEDGLISVEKINISVKRIIKSKYDLGLFDSQREIQDPVKILGKMEHKAIVDKIP